MGSRGESTVLVYKPALGSRGDGVELLAEGDLAGTRSLLALLAHDDMLLQPFLQQVARDGEICVCFVNGRFLHAVLKDPRGWGAAQPAVPTPSPSEPPPVTAEKHRPHPSSRQCVRKLESPPALVVAIAHRAVDLCRCRCGAGPLYLARVDFLPGPGGSWLISELELGWPEMFLRVAPQAAAGAAAQLCELLAVAYSRSKSDDRHEPGGPLPKRQRPAPKRGRESAQSVA